MPTETKKFSLMSKIESREDALKVAKEVSTAFFVLAAVQGAIGAFIMPSMIIDAILYAVLAAMLRMWKSRVVAVILLLLATASAVTTVLTKFGVAELGGGNIFLAGAVLWAGIRGVQATFLLRGRFAAAPDELTTPPSA
jgi:hypothetical protein